jgi:hypothetical protein
VDLLSKVACTRIRACRPGQQVRVRNLQQPPKLIELKAALKMLIDSVKTSVSEDMTSSAIVFVIHDTPVHFANLRRQVLEECEGVSFLPLEASDVMNSLLNVSSSKVQSQNGFSLSE